MENTNIKAVEAVKISKNTLTLIKCRAAMSDVFKSVNSVHQDVYGNDTDEITEKYRAKFHELDSELCALIANIVDNQMLESNYQEI